MTETLAHYLEGKKKYPFRGKNYYKVKDYKESFYIDADIIEQLDTGTKEVDLERNTQARIRSKGMVKWDPLQKKILLSVSKVRLYYKPFDIE